jgi:site-specific recombinase XerD
VQEFRDRHGIVRRYLRRPGSPRVSLSGEPGSAEFMAAYTVALTSKVEPAAKAQRYDSRSVAAAVSLYLASARYAELAPDTREMRRRELERFRVDHGERALHRLDRSAVERLVARKRPHSAINFLKSLSPFLDWCVIEQLIATNPAKGVQRPKVPNSGGFATWTEGLVEQYRAYHTVDTKPRQAFELLVNVGAARVDTALLGRQHVRNGLLIYRRHKTNVLVEIPILPGLQAVIDAMPAGQLAFIATEQGTPYTKESFGNMFRRWCDDAGIPKGYSAHGLRKYAAVVRAELGATVPELMAWFGWLSMRESERYTRDAERRKLAISLGRKVNPKLSTPAQG